MNNIDQRTCRVRFLDCRARRAPVRVELTLDMVEQTWIGERAAIDDMILLDARQQIAEGAQRGGVYPFDLVTFEVAR